MKLLLQNQNLSKKILRKTLNSNKNIVLGLSGGVDSATSAALLMAQGYNVIGVTCLFVDNQTSRQAIHDARAVCEFLGLRHMVYDFRDYFEQTVVAPFCDSYVHGETPSPCVICNRDCKIPCLIAVADDLGIHDIATGHYARVVDLLDQQRKTIKTALDSSKDQSYMLMLLDQSDLERLVLPLGGYTKLEVRSHAERLGIPVAHRAESQDLCFFAGDYRDFLAQRNMEAEPGPISLLDGTEVGEHQGLYRYTLGQRKGLGVALGKPCFVIDKDACTNTLYVGFKEDALIRSAEVEDPNWMAFEKVTDPISCTVKVRYRSPATPCTVIPLSDNRFKVEFVRPQSLTAPGQFAAFYEGSILLGGAKIVSLEHATN